MGAWQCGASCLAISPTRAAAGMSALSSVQMNHGTEDPDVALCGDFRISIGEKLYGLSRLYRGPLAGVEVEGFGLYRYGPCGSQFNPSARQLEHRPIWRDSNL